MPNQLATNDFFRQFTHRSVQDLAWCLVSPALISDNSRHDWHQLAPTPDLLTKLLALDADPTPLEDWLDNSPSPRLGLMFERFWQFWWLSSDDDDQWRFNLQINHNGKTLGELDAIQWQSNSQSLAHYEMAVKFYLEVPTSSLSDLAESTGTRWVGPNLIDRLDIKWPQMRDRQLTIMTDPDRAPSLEWTPQKLTTSSLTRGRLFKALNPGSELQRTEPTEGAINPKHESGYWLHLSDWITENSHHWKLLTRKEWFAPISVCESREAQNSLTTKTLLTEHFKRNEQPIQVSRLVPRENQWQEDQRYFVVPDNWPPSK